MSYINEALKKAQKEKDAGYLKGGGLLVAGSKDRKRSHVRHLFWSLLIILLVLCALFTYFRFDSQPQQIYVTPQPRPQPKPVPKPKPKPKPKPVPKPKPKPKIEVPPSPSQADKIDELKNIYEKARLLHKNGRLEAARRLYQETLRLDPGYVDALNNLGVLYIHEKDLPAARRYLEKAVKLDPGHAEIYYNLACLHAILGEVRRSLAYLKKAIALNHEVREWAQADTDLINIRDLPQFKEIVQQSSNS